MRRPHRSIEVFDISLMAVVTKAMGAFLVLMLLLMPYYSSGPIGQQEARDLAAKVDQVTQNIKQVMDELSTASAEDLRKRLEDALKQLDEAQKLITELHRANDALNSQVSRLEDEKAALASRAAELQRRVDALSAQVDQLQQQNEALAEELDKAKGNVIAAQLINWDCLDSGTAIVLGIWTMNSYIGKDKSKYILSYGSGLGTEIYQTDRELSAKLSDSQRSPPGHGTRFDSSDTIYSGADADRYMLIVTSPSLQIETAANGDKIIPLMKLPSNCTVIISHQLQFKDGTSLAYAPQEFVVQKDQYATIIEDLVISDKTYNIADPSPEELRWLQDQIDHAAKVR